MAQTKSKLSEVLNAIAKAEGFLNAESTAKVPAGAKAVAIEPTGGNLIEAGLKDGDVLLIENSAAAEKEVTFAAGDSPPSIRKGQGTAVVKLPEKSQTMVVLETARHFDKSGNLAMTFSAGSAGKIAVLRFGKQ